MKLFGLIGKNISHSFSANFFNEKFKKHSLKEHEYRLFPLEKIHDLPALIQAHPNLTGLNVTIPYKQSVIPFLNELSEVAQITQAVNTISIIRRKSGYSLYGDNTDYFGFKESLPKNLSFIHKHALILGTGGAAQTVKFVLRELDINTCFVSRQKTNNTVLLYEELKKQIIETHTLIVNATPVGMYPNVEERPLLPYGFIASAHLVYDLIYNPEETQLLQTARHRGASIQNGLKMLYLQADKSWQIWNQIT